MGENYARRTVLRTAPVVGLSLFAGCSTILSGAPPDVVVFNKTGSSLTAEIEVVDQQNDETVLSETAEIDSNGAAEYADALSASGDYAMTVETNGGRAGEHRWSVSSEEQSMQVRISSDSMDFSLVSP